MRMSARVLNMLFICACAAFIIGCAPLLPSGRETVRSPWKTFDDAKEAYESIELGMTTKDDLQCMGFDPFLTPNIKILNYSDIVSQFMLNPSIKMEDLDEGLQSCIKARAACQAYQVKPGIVNRKRLGNVWLDLFDFKRKVHSTGWRFEALVVMVNDIVVYKQWGGEPLVDEDTVSKKPLGPLQSSGSGGLLLDVVK
jgi:hypothetical protein